MLRENTNTRSQGVPIDEEQEAVIVLMYVSDDGGNGGVNRLSLQVRDEGGVNNINYKYNAVLDVLTEWNQDQPAIGGGSRQIMTVLGKKDYAGNAACGFRLAYKVNTSNN